MATLQAPAYVGMSAFATSPRICRSKLSSHSRACLPRTVVRNSRVLQSTRSSLGFSSSSITETRLQGHQMNILHVGKGYGGGALGATCTLPTSPETLRWVFLAAASVLLFIKNTGIQKQFLVPLLALEIPREALGWMKGEYGLWTAFLALGVKLFYHIPGELELPLYLLLLIITAPVQLAKYRGSTAAAVITLALAAYTAYQHFQSSGSVKGAFESPRLAPTIACIALLVIPVVMFAYGVYY